MHRHQSYFFTILKCKSFFSKTQTWHKALWILVGKYYYCSCLMLNQYKDDWFATRTTSIAHLQTIICIQALHSSISVIIIIFNKIACNSFHLGTFWGSFYVLLIFPFGSLLMSQNERHTVTCILIIQLHITIVNIKFPKF